MKIPSRLNELISKNQRLHSIVLRAASTIEPWAQENKTVFFHEYTDHSLKHLEEVLLTAEGLISDNSWGHLTAEDGAIMVLSVLLHDCALHISEDGFFSLIDGKFKPEKSRYTKPETEWPLLWEKFLAEARRFDQRKLYSLFGDSQPIQTPPRQKLNLTLKNRLLIGEFLRRHHARLAHEIALSGIPGHSNPLAISEPDAKNIMDLAGYVARSHNLSIRAAVDALESTHKRVHQNCRVPFAMMVLRIADYLQIHASRAPGQLLQLKSLASPISRGEWRKHLSVQEINQAHDDPEAIYIDSEPESAATFLSMRSLLRDIQNELDSCWALLGEVYGRAKPLDALGITIRRIRSNLDNPETFQETRNPGYLPREFKFKTASAELMDLLAAPLYGNSPEIGIRELVQNAVDACRERDDLISKEIINHKINPEYDVVVTLNTSEDGKATLIVEDYGVGMTPDVVDQYLLNIGASFRRSDAWRNNHENDGHSTVHRTGRFGIGLLAAFLLGPEIRVTTRSISTPEESAITFSCKQGEESIEVRPCEFHFGTKIEINLPEDTAKELIKEEEKWDWYCLTNPNVTRIINNGSQRHLKQKNTVPDCDAEIDKTEWRRIRTTEYDDVLWTFDKIPNKYHYLESRIMCNGFIITTSTHTLDDPHISKELSEIVSEKPSIVVFDPDGRFPINLQRDQLTGDKTGFEEELANDISEFFTSQIIEVFEHSKPGITKENIIKSINPKIPGLNTIQYPRNQLSTAILSKTGIIPTDSDLIRAAEIDSIVIDAVDIASDRGSYTSNKFTAWAKYYIAVPEVTATKTSRANFIRRSIEDEDYTGKKFGYFSALGVIGRRIFIRKKDVAELVTPGSIPRKTWSRMSLEKEVGNWGLWSHGHTPKLNLDIETVCQDLESSGSLGFTIVYLDPQKNKNSKEYNANKNQPSPFAEAWYKSVHSPLLKQRPR